MIWSISWKNVWRNKVRSGVVIAAFTVGIFGSVYMVAFMVGMAESRIKLAIGNETSHIQIHNPEYLENNELKYTIENKTSIVEKIRKIPEVKGVSPRIKVLGMASTSGNASGVMINGIDIKMEREVSGIADCLVPGGGTFFDGKGRKPIVVGEKLAKSLKLSYYQLTQADLAVMEDSKKIQDFLPVLSSIKDDKFRSETEFDKKIEGLLGEKEASRVLLSLKEEAIKYNLRRKIVLSFQALDGHIAYDAFRVVGVYKTGNTGFDGLNVFVLNTDIAGVAAMGGDQVNQIAVLLHSAEDDELVSGIIKSFLPGKEVQTWKEVNPEARMYTQAMDFFLFIFLAITLLALGFGIVNTMLMAVLERVKELGMLMAVGMNKKRVFSMIMLETIFLALVGSVIGLVISYLLIWYTGTTGVDLSALYKEGLEAMGISAKVYPELGFEALAEILFLVILTGILASIYPARKALKLNPADAIRVDM